MRRSSASWLPHGGVFLHWSAFADKEAVRVEDDAHMPSGATLGPSSGPECTVGTEKRSRGVRGPFRIRPDRPRALWLR